MPCSWIDDAAPQLLRRRRCHAPDSRPAPVRDRRWPGRLQPGSLRLIDPALDPFDELVAALRGDDHGDCRADPGAEEPPGDERPESLYQFHDALQRRLISAARPGAIKD